MVASFECVIRGGTVVDGTGQEPFVADIAIKNGRIVEVGRVEALGEQEIDAAGRLVTPGFVDIHTHYDGQAIWSPRMTPSSSHGVTTVVMGNCGVGFAPCRREDHDLLINVMEGVEDIPGAVMAEGLAWDWETFPQYLDALDDRPRDIDTAAYLPHSPLRVYAMGQRGANREPATDDDLARMRDLTREAIEAGALGFASSRLIIHRTADGAAIPSYDASEVELEAIADGLKDAGRGIIQMVMNIAPDRWTGAVALLRRLSERSGRAVTFTLGSGNTGAEEWRHALNLVEDANCNGASITAQVFPRPIGLVQGHALSVNPFCKCESYKALATLPFEEKIRELRKPEVRARLIAEPAAEGTMLAMLGRNYDWMFPLSDPPNYEPSPETSVGATARRLGLTPEEVVYDMLLQDDGKAMVYVALGNFYNASLDSVREMLLHKDTVLGLGDGGAHYGMICDASYPTFVLQHWTRDREEGRLPLAWAIKALANDPARAVGLNDRGRIAPGYKADINIIDYDRLRLHAPTVVFDLPGGGRRLDQIADGYELTMVSGKIINRGGEPTGELPGKLVRGQQQAAS